MSDAKGHAAPRKPVSDLASFISRPAQALPQFPGLRVLFADDNATNRLILKAMLDRLGAVVTLAEDGEAALKLWQPQQFDVIMLDIAMPVLCGVTTLQRLHEAAEATGEVLSPAIAVTANAPRPLIAEYQAAGFAAVVLKPALLADISAALAQVVPRKSSAGTD